MNGDPEITPPEPDYPAPQPEPPVPTPPDYPVPKPGDLPDYPVPDPEKPPPGPDEPWFKNGQRDSATESLNLQFSLSLHPSVSSGARRFRYKKATSDFRSRRFSQGVKVNLEAYNYDCNSLPGLNRMVFPSGMATCVPVRGLRPMPRLRGLTTKTPKPRSSMRSPRFMASFIASKRASTATSAFIFGTPVFSATLLMMSSLITDSLTQEASIQFDSASVSMCLFVFKGLQKKQDAL
jgi:hypothetical protein